MNLLKINSVWIIVEKIFLPKTIALFNILYNYI